VFGSVGQWFEKRCEVAGRGLLRAPATKHHCLECCDAHLASGNGSRGVTSALGWEPRQISTGDRTILRKISKQGNRYLRVLRASGPGRAGEAEQLGTLRAQVLDRSRQETTTPQCAGDRARQQACSHRLGSSQQGAQIRMCEDKCDGVPICVSVAPCSGPSRRGLESGAEAGTAAFSAG
jgi:hypothetical protein